VWSDNIDEKGAKVEKGKVGIVDGVREVSWAKPNMKKEMKERTGDGFTGPMYSKSFIQQGYGTDRDLASKGPCTTK
jgi:hypothetical protein